MKDSEDCNKILNRPILQFTHNLEPRMNLEKKLIRPVLKGQFVFHKQLTWQRKLTMVPDYLTSAWRKKFVFGVNYHITIKMTRPI